MVMSESVLREHLGMGVIRALPLSLGLGRALPPFGLMTRKDSLPSEPARAFAELLREGAMTLYDGGPEPLARAAHLPPSSVSRR